MNGSRTDTVLMMGPGARIVVEVDSAGNGPVASFLVELERKKRSDFTKIMALLRKAAEVGPQNIRNQEKVRTLGDGLLEFKSFQVRIFWMYGTSSGDQRTVVLLDGLVKKRDKHKAQDMKRARALMAARSRRKGKS